MAFCGSTTRGAQEGMISRGFGKDPLIASYLQQLGRAQWAGRIIGVMHSLCSILAFCNLTWATVVLLGAYVDNLLSTDYYIVFTLLLLEGSRLASAALFTQLNTRVPNPGHFTCIAEPMNHRFSTSIRLLSLLLQVLLIAPSFVCSIIRYSRIRYPASIPNLQISLRIFYTLVILNAAISTLFVLLSATASICFETLSESSVLKYYDEVLHNTLVKGAVKADGFNYFHFAFGLLGRDYASYKSWGEVLREHKQLLRYMYAHKQGADYLLACLDSEDATVQQAAANTVGAWAEGLRKDKVQVELPVELLTKLADVVGTGEVGWAAVNSFGALARNNAECLMKTLTSSKQPVLERIAELVDGSSSRSLASVRTLIFVYDVWPQALESDKSTERGSICSSWKLRDDVKEHLVRELQCLVVKSSVQRLRVHAAYLLDLLNFTVRDHIKSITPGDDSHWYSIEKEMLQHLLTKWSLPSPAKYPPDMRDSEHSLSRPPGPPIPVCDGAYNAFSIALTTPS